MFFFSGKLKASQLLNINPAALLPGAKPRLKVEQTPTSPEPEVRTNVLSEEISSRPDSAAANSPGSSLTFISPSSPSTSSESTTEKVLPPMSALLPNVNKVSKILKKQSLLHFDITLITL